MSYGLVNDWDEAFRIVQQLKRNNKKIVFTNGCFDIIHCAHVKLLEYAKSLGDFLVVGLNSDESVSRIKGRKRPIFPFKDRAKVLTSLRVVDLVVPFNEDTPYSLILKLKPDIIVKGGDYREEDVVGADMVKSWGGEVKIFDYIKGYSTSQIIKNLMQK